MKFLSKIKQWLFGGLILGTDSFTSQNKQNITVSGTASFADGTAAAPSITFTADPDTGIYRKGANNIGISTNGNLVCEIASGGGFALSRTGVSIVTPGTINAVSATDVVLNVGGGIEIKGNTTRLVLTNNNGAADQKVWEIINNVNSTGELIIARLNDTVAARTTYVTFAQGGLVTFTAGIVLSSGQTTLSNYLEGTFTPTVTLVGGAGNTVPVYSTNTGRYTRVGNRVFVDVYLTGDGGNEGAGTGTFNVALPIAASASHPTSFFPIGYGLNNVTEYELFGQIAGSASVVSLQYFNLISTSTAFTGADQNNTTRTIRLKFMYEV